jgi:predicted nucleic acid-binding protein
MTDYVVLDTDVASLTFRNRLPTTMAARLAGKLWCVSVVTVGEMTQWAELRAWGPRNKAGLEDWLSRLAILEVSWEAARIWGRLSAASRSRGQTAPINDAWIAACCLAEGLPLATLNTKDYADFAQHHGLNLISAT